MQKQGRRAGGTERGGDFLRNNPALAHAGNYHAPALFTAAEDQLDSAFEIRGHGAFEPFGKSLKGCGLGTDECGGFRAACTPIAGN
jgi:hypothetical protein